MNDELKKFVDSNREGFDDREPSSKVWDGIDRSLPEMKRRSLWNSVVIWRAAAMLLLATSVYLLATRPTPAAQKPTDATLAQVDDLESFYSHQIAEKVALIEDISVADEEDSFTQDFQKLEAMYQVLREEMKNHPSKKVKDALVLNLLVRVDLLNQQIKKLEDRKKEGRKPDSMT